MKRRAFLATLAAAAAGLALDPERALWVPGAKTIFLPTPPPTVVSPVALTRGDIFTMSGVFSVHPQTGQILNHLQQFVITEDVSAGDVALAHIHPQTRHNGEYRNVNHFGGHNTIQPLYVGQTIPCAVEWVAA
jgi:hypothetical protein